MTRASDLAKLLGAGATINDGTTITTADNTDQLTLTSTDADANAGPNLLLYRNSSSAADSDRLATITYRGTNDADENVDYIVYDSFITDASNGTEDSELDIRTMVGGSETTRILLDPAETVFNEGSVDLDFRVESNGNANMLFVDGGNDRVGIGAVPDVPLLVSKSASDHTSAALSIRNSVAGGYGSILNFESANTSGTVLKAATIGTDGAENWASTANTSSNLKFSTMNDGTLTEAMRLDKSGSLLLQKTSVSQSGGGTYFDVPTDASTMPVYLRFCKTFSGLREAVSFAHAGSGVGGILFDNTGTSFSTSSDYRLKENVVTDWDATTRLKQLKPARFNFITDADKTVDGFLAHEVSSIVPEAITGTKDEVEVWEDGEELPDGVSVGDNKLDDDGNTIPKYQSIDQSKIVPLLVKTIQELEARITALESA